MIIVDYSKSYLKQFKKAPIKIRKQAFSRIQLFLKDPYHPALNNHPLTAKYSGYRSINITGDWRAIYFQENENLAIFVALGTHSQLYQ